MVVGHRADAAGRALTAMTAMTAMRVSAVNGWCCITSRYCERLPLECSPGYRLMWSSPISSGGEGFRSRIVGVDSGGGGAARVDGGDLDTDRFRVAGDVEYP